jgi:hypothetical protein
MADRTLNPVFEAVSDDSLQVKIADLGNACWTVCSMFITLVMHTSIDVCHFVFVCFCRSSINISLKIFKHDNIDRWK